MKIQRVELCKRYDTNIHCPYCGNLILNNDKLGQAEEALEVSDVLTPCLHTLFFAHDEGLEFRSMRFDSLKNISDFDEDAIVDDDDFLGWDSYTDDIEVSDGVKFAMYVGAPSSMGSYIGFATLDDNQILRVE